MKLIVLLPTDKFSRRNAERIENTKYDKTILKGCLVIPLTEFMDLANDEDIELGNYWVSYVYN